MTSSFQRHSELQNDSVFIVQVSICSTYGIRHTTGLGLKLNNRRRRLRAAAVAEAVGDAVLGEGGVVAQRHGLAHLGALPALC